MAPKRTTKQSAGLTQTKLRGGNTSAKAAAKGKAPAPRKSASEISLRESTPVKEDKRPAKTARKETETVDLTKEKKEERPALDPNGKEWNVLWKEAKAEMGGMAPIHGEKDTKVQNILRVFDMTSKYGPYVGITRLERWERAKKWGLQPPEEIKQILLTQQGKDDAVYRESVIFGWV